MTESFGVRLRHQRERKQIPLASIAQQTKINLSLLEGLERDDVSNWPSGIFRRAFIRAYARIVGLEHDSTVREFLELYPDPVEVPEAAPPPSDGETAGRRPPTRLTCLIASALSSLRRRRLEAARKRRAPTGAEPAEPASSQAGWSRSLAAESMPAPVVSATRRPEADLSDVARLCTELSRVPETGDVASLLERVAEALDAIGLIVWVSDPQGMALNPALAHGYSNEVLARLPKVRRDSDNATAASFRSAQTSIVKGGELANGAIVVPLMTPAGCMGVLAVELPHGGEQKESVRAMTTIFAAQLATVVGSVPLAEAVNA